MSIIDNESYRKIHFAVMAIESGAKKLNISGQEMERRLKNKTLSINDLLPNTNYCILKVLIMWQTTLQRL